MSSHSLCNHVAKLSRSAQQLLPKSTVSSPHSKTFNPGLMMGGGSIILPPPPSIDLSRGGGCHSFSSIRYNKNKTHNHLASSPQINRLLLLLNSSIFPKHHHLFNSQPYSYTTSSYSSSSSSSTSSTTSAPATSQKSPSSSSSSASDAESESDELSIEEYHRLSNRYIDTLVSILEQLQEDRADVDCEYSAGVLTLYFPPHGTYVLNKQPPNKQIWLSSPVSGPKRYDYVKIKGSREGDWIYGRDGSRLSELLERELGLGS